MEKECILGIKANGVSFKIDTLSIESDQIAYDYICNVGLYKSNNGNGSYKISIVDSNFVSGFPIAKWKLTSASITFSWGYSSTYFVLADNNGHETKSISASEQRGTTSGFNIEFHARSIFPKAVQIVSEYPSAYIYNAYMEFNCSKPKLESLKRYLERSEVEDCIKYFAENTLDKLNDYISKYKKLKTLLEESEDVRSKSLLVKATDECQKVITTLYS